MKSFLTRINQELLVAEYKERKLIKLKIEIKVLKVSKLLNQIRKRMYSQINYNLKESADSS